MSQSHEYYQPASMVIKNISFEYSNADVWYWVERSNLGKIYNIVVYDTCAVVHFANNNMKDINNTIRENHNNLELGKDIKIFIDKEKKNYWNAKKYIDETSLFDQESIRINEDFQEELFPNVTDNRFERMASILFDSMNLSYSTQVDTVMHNDHYIDIESQYDMV
jgi:hypothetical protein